MTGLLGGLRYALRQFRHSPVFTITAVLTLSLGIGGTTAIFTLIHAVMLRSLPVSEPARLYRIGDGDDCCVEGGPQDRWGMFSYPLFERLKESTPEFEELTAFQAGGGRLSVRRERVDVAARPLRSEYVTGNYFTTLGIEEDELVYRSWLGLRQQAVPVGSIQRIDAKRYSGAHGGLTAHTDFAHSPAR